MRIFVAAFASLIVIMAVPALASPTLHPAGIRSGFLVQPAADDCGRGYHRRHWWANGREHWGECVPN